VPAPC